jgi:hypothetical protein
MRCEKLFSYEEIMHFAWEFNMLEGYLTDVIHVRNASSIFDSDASISMHYTLGQKL